MNTKPSPASHRESGSHKPKDIPPPAKTSSPVEKSDKSNDSGSSDNKQSSVSTEKTLVSPGSKENYPPSLLPKEETNNLQNVDNWIDKDHGWHNLQKEGLGRLSEEFSSDDEKDDGDEELDDVDDDDDMGSRLDDVSRIVQCIPMG